MQECDTPIVCRNRTTSGSRIRLYSSGCAQVSGQVGGIASGTVSGIVGEPVQLLINAIGERVFGISELQNRMKIKSRRYIHEVMLTPAINGGYVFRSYPDKPNHPKQRYYLSEKGLKLVK